MRAYLEITNVCNRKCRFCPGTQREKCFVEPDVLRRRIARLYGVDELYLHLLGEPLLHPQFPAITEVCRAAAIPVNLTTNGTLLNDSLQDVLLNNPVFRQINFSLQALNPEEIPVLDRILDFCMQALTRRPELYLNLRMWNLGPDYAMPEQNLPFLTEIFRKLNLPRPDQLEFHQNWRSKRLTGRLYLHCGSEFEWPVRASGADPAAAAYCHGLNSQFGVLADGTVVPCCLDSEGTIALGNLDRQPLKEILSSDRAEAIRSGFRHGCAAEPLCRRCTYRENHAGKPRSRTP